MCFFSYLVPTVLMDSVGGNLTLGPDGNSTDCRRIAPVSSAMVALPLATSKDDHAELH